MSLYSSQIARRSPWTCLSCSTLSRATQALVTAPIPNSSPARIHQRKHSSSKVPNSSKNDARALTTPSKSLTKEALSAAKDSPEKRPTTRISKRKSKEGVQEDEVKANYDLEANLPSVPTTNHLHPSDIHMSSFFSIHRPISVTTPIPSESSNKAFSSIFNSRALPKHKPADVIYTLSSALDTLESAASTAPNSRSQQMTPEEMDLRQAVTQASTSNADRSIQHLDIPAKTFHINLQELAKSFRPFTPPPAPMPIEPSESTSLPDRLQPQAEVKPTHKSYTTTLTIHEATYPNGQKTYKTQTTPIIEVPALPGAGDGDGLYLPPPPRNQPFLGRMRTRQLQYMERLADREGWMAISVKRQRKLKMKKHKYKKLMKRTKNLRRRLDRT